MSAEIEQLLHEAVTEHDQLPDANTTWARGRARRRRSVATLLAGTGIGAAVAIVGVTALLDTGPVPSPVIDQPAATQAPSPAPSEQAGPARPPDPTIEPTPDEPARPGLDGLDGAGWVAVTADGGTLVRSDGDDVALPASATLRYPDRMHAFVGGGVAWQVGGEIWVALPTELEPRVLATGAPDGFWSQQLTGVGEIDGEAVVLASRDRANSLTDDQGGQLVALRLDGEVHVLREYSSAYEAGTAATGLVDGWMLVEEWDLAERVLLVVAPDGQRSVVARVREDSSVERVADAVLVRGPDGGAPRVVVLTRDEHPDAPYGRNGFEVLDAADLESGPVLRREVVELDAWLPKALSASGELVLVSALPDAQQAFSVDLATGAVERYAVPGLVALVPAPGGDADAGG